MKSRLRHPIRALSEPFGKAGLVLAMIALIAALGGTALAAKGALTHKQKKEVENLALKEAKKYAGKQGAKGNPGAPGPVGPSGANGKDGAAGAEGKQGPEGKQGVTGKEGSEGLEGLEGTEGPEGSPWTVGGVLPSGKTETGSWAMLGGGATGLAQISFSIPLTQAAAQGIGGSQAIFVPVGGTVPANCDGGTAAEPKATPGFLCVYGASGSFSEPPFILKSGTGTIAFGASSAGAILGGVNPTGPAPLGNVSGTWAVTAP